MWIEISEFSDVSDAKCFAERVACLEFPLWDSGRLHMARVLAVQPTLATHCTFTSAPHVQHTCCNMCKQQLHTAIAGCTNVAHSLIGALQLSESS